MSDDNTATERKAFCIKCRSFFTANAHPVRLGRHVGVTPRIGWKLVCTKCGSPTLISQPLVVTYAVARKDLEDIADTIEWIIEGADGTSEITGQPIEADVQAAVYITPVSLGYDQLRRDYWHPTEWTNITLALEQLFDVKWTKVEAAALYEEPREFGRRNTVALYGHLYHGQPIYYLGKADYQP